jgi:hypothetical protein
MEMRVGGIGSLMRYGAHISHRGRRPELTPGCSSMHLHKDSDVGLGCAVILEERSGGEPFRDSKHHVVVGYFCAKTCVLK